MIHFYPQRAAQLWLKQEKSTLSEENAVNIIVNSEYEWTMTPKKVMVFANFMNKIGVIQSKPAIWTELFFENIKLYFTAIRLDRISGSERYALVNWKTATSTSGVIIIPSSVCNATIPAIMGASPPICLATI